MTFLSDHGPALTQDLLKLFVVMSDIDIECSIIPDEYVKITAFMTHVYQVMQLYIDAPPLMQQGSSTPSGHDITKVLSNVDQIVSQLCVDTPRMPTS